MIIIIGIYKILNTSNGKIYIGQSIHIEKRWREHRNMLAKGNHNNKHLQNSYNLGNNLVFSIVELCDKGVLTEREDFWIKYFNTTNRNKGYNKRDAGSSGVFSEESIRKMSKSHKGRNLGSLNASSKISEEFAIEIINQLLLGKKVSKVAKELNCSYKIVYHIKRKETWTHLTKNIEFPCSFTNKHKGIYYDKRYGIYTASIQVNKINVYREYFKSEEEAIKAYERKQNELQNNNM